MEPSSLIQDVESRQDLLLMQKYADAYVKHKKRILALMEKSVEEPLPPGLTHAEAIELYVDLLQYPQFSEEVDQLISPYNNAIATAIVAGVTAITAGITKIISQKKEEELIEQRADLEEQQFFRALVMNKMQGSDTGKILLVSVIALAAVGGAIYLIVKSRK